MREADSDGWSVRIGDRCRRIDWTRHRSTGGSVVRPLLVCIVLEIAFQLADYCQPGTIFDAVSGMYGMAGLIMDGGSYYSDYYSPEAQKERSDEAFSGRRRVWWRCH